MKSRSRETLRQNLACQVPAELDAHRDVAEFQFVGDMQPYMDP